MRRVCFLSLVCLVGLSACTSPREAFSNKTPQMVADPDNVSAMLADAADRVAVSLEKLAAVEYQRSPGIAVAPIENAPVELRRAITVNWVGPAEPIVQTLADRASYNFSVFGVQPAVPIVVSIDAENQPVVEVLRDIGLQMGLRADIRVDASMKLVEIHYSPTTGVGQ